MREIELTKLKPKSPKANRAVLGPLLLAAFLAVVEPANGQQADPHAAKQFWPSLDVTLEPGSRIYIQALAEKHDGEDAFRQLKIGALVSYRMRRIIKPLIGDTDKENDYNLAIGGGYELIKTHQSGSDKQEHRLMVQLTPKYVVPYGFLCRIETASNSVG